jgi:hypothetical protein
VTAGDDAPESNDGIGVDQGDVDHEAWSDPFDLGS